MDYKDKDKATTGTPDGHRSATSTGSGTAPTGAEPKQRHSNGGRWHLAQATCRPRSPARR